MTATDDRTAMRRVLAAVDDFIDAARRVTRRSLVDGARSESVRFEASRKAFERAKDQLLAAIDQIDGDSELGRNIQKLFETRDFERLLKNELSLLRGEGDSKTRNNRSDVLAMSSFPTEEQTMEFEAELFRRLRLASANLIERPHVEKTNE